MRAPLHLAFVLEQTLGHVTHSANLRAALADDAVSRISWLPVEYHTDDRWRHLPLVSRNWTLTASLMARRRLVQLRRRAPIDGYFFHTHVTALGALDLMRCHPAVVSIDATPLAFDTIGAAYGHRSLGPIEHIKHVPLRALFQRAAALVSWSEWAKRSLVEDYDVPPERVVVVPPGTDLSLWAWQRPAPVDDRPVRVLFVGGDFTRKGGEDLLAACAPLLPDRCEVHVVTRAPVAARPGVVVHQGVAPNSAELRRLYAAADIFALPTYADGLPMVIMEAMAAGLPVISTPVGSVAEAVAPGVTGFLVAPGAVSELRTALTALIEQPALRRTMGSTARAVAEQRFDAHQNARLVRDLLVGAVAEWRDHGRRDQ